MGHLVSARALRLGWTFNWADSWFAVQKSDYSYFLFLCFRLRYFLLSYFYSKKRDKSSYIYSHFNIVKYSRIILIKIFFYDAVFEENRRYILPKVLKFVNRTFDDYLYRNKFINSASMGILLDSELNKKKRNWLRFFFKTQKRLNIDISNIYKIQLNNKLRKFLFNIFNNLIFILLIHKIKFSNKNLNNFSFNQTRFIKFCFNKLKLSYPVKFNKVGNLQFNYNKYNNLIDSWNYSWILPYQELSDVDYKKKKNIFKQNINLFKFAYLYSFNQYMFRYYMSLVSSNWFNWKLLNNFQSKKIIKSGFNIKNNCNFMSFNNWYSLYFNQQKLSNISAKKNLSNINSLSYNSDNKFRFGFIRRNFITNKNISKKLSVYSNISFLLIFISYFGILRFNTSFDWQYWYFLIKNIQKKDYNFIYKYFSYRSLFTSISYSVNLAQMSALFGFLGLLTDLSSYKKLYYFISEFIQNLYLMIITRSFINIIWFCLYYKMKYFVFDHNLVSQYYIISNDTINSIFLSRYIAKMLDYNNTLRDTLNPVKREFFQLVKRTGLKFNVDNVNEEKRKNVFYKLVFKYILSILFIIYDVFLMDYFNKESIYFTLDMFIIYKWIYRFSLNNNKQFDLHKIFVLCKNFILRRSSFICLFINNIKIKYSLNFNKLLINNLLNVVNPIIKIQRLFNFIFLDLFLNKSMLFFNNKFVDIPWNIKLIRFSLIHFSNFFKYQYTAFSYYSLSEITSINI